MAHSYKTNDPKGWMGDPKRGAALGRWTIQGELKNGETLSIIRKQLDDGGYDENGTYFGIGDPLFWVSSEDGSIDYMIRAKNIADARIQVGNTYIYAKLGGDVCDISLDNITLQEILNGECESLEREYCDLNDEIKSAAKEFEAAVLKTLEAWVGQNLWLIEIENNGFRPDEDGLITSSIVREMSGLGGGAGYLYYMEQEGAGVGTWDGDWDRLFKDPQETLRALSDIVKKATYNEYQKLLDALMDCALKGG